MQVGSPTTIGIAAGLGLVSAYAVSADEAFNLGPGGGAVVPAAAIGLSATGFAAGLAGSPAWLWGDSQALRSIGLRTGMGALAAAVGGTVGIGLALATEPIGGRQPDAAPDTSAAIRAQAKEIDDRSVAMIEESVADNEARRDEVRERLPGATAERDAARDAYVKAVQRADDRPAGSIPVDRTGRLHLGGLRVGEAADVVFDAYGEGRDKLRWNEQRGFGHDRFGINRLLDQAWSGPLDRGRITKLLDRNVDTGAQPGFITDTESALWQAGRLGERRQEGVR